MTRRRYPSGRSARNASPTERVERYAVEDENGCWIWSAYIDPTTGYGQVTVLGKTHKAHRLSYEAFVGPIPTGLHIDHLCRVRHCVNPEHLEPVSCLENVRRSPLTHGSETRCPRDHSYDDANTYTARGRRYCRTCQRAYMRLWKALSPEDRAHRKAAGLEVVDLHAHFAELAVSA